MPTIAITVASGHLESAIITELLKDNVPSFIIQMSFPFVALQSRFTKKPPEFTEESIAVLKHGHPNMSNQNAREELGNQNPPLEASIKDLINWKKTLN
ncbi:MAG: hypothetical protein QNL61_01740 [Crocinitomicaceae bacterium]